MQQIKEVQEVFGFVASLRTLLDNYPELQMDDRLMKLLNTNSPLGFLLNLMEICGVSKEELLDWLSKILCGAEAFTNNVSENINNGANEMNVVTDNKVTNGILDSIEMAVKGILLSNIKNMFTCSINPFIPSDIIKYPVPNSDDEFINGKGVVIPISTIDLFNTLQQHPNSTLGKNMYFDNTMKSNDYWQSTDFNVFLWYIINKSSNFNNEGLKKIWDNRVLKRKALLNNEVYRTNFFQLFKGNDTYISNNNIDTQPSSFQRNTKKNKSKNDKNNNKSIKRQYLIVDYNEINASTTVPNVLTLWLNGDRYRKKVGDTYINKTVFEFNYDYIYSLKLFDSKTLVANVINSIMGITNSIGASAINVKYSLEQEIIAGIVSKIVTKVMEDDETIINDCFFSFSNNEFELLMEDAENKYHNNYQFGEIKGRLSQEEIDDLSKSINTISNSATLNEQQTKIKNLFTGIASSTAAKNSEIGVTDKFSFGQSIIFDILKESITQIVLQVLSPKVMMLYVINSYFMGDIVDGDFSKINITNLLKGLSNLIISMVKQVLQMLINELLKELLIVIKDLLNAMLRLIVREHLEFYLEIIKRLLALIDMFYNTFKSGNNESIIDNVNYADIVPTQNKPKEETC